jgi:hypothetical protein
MEQVIQTIAWVLSPMSVKRISSASFSKKKWEKTDWSGLRLRLKYGTVRLLLFRPGFPANACICASGLLVLIANRCCYLGNSIHSLADISGGVTGTFDALANAIVLQEKGMDALADALIALENPLIALENTFVGLEIPFNDPADGLMLLEKEFSASEKGFVALEKACVVLEKGLEVLGKNCSAEIFVFFIRVFY